MVFNAYRKLAAAFAVYPPEHAETYLTLGLLAEVGELTGKYAKRLRGDTVPREAILHECGGVLWFVARLADGYGVELDPPDPTPMPAAPSETLLHLHTMLGLALNCDGAALRLVDTPLSRERTLRYVVGRVQVLLAAEGYTLADALSANLAKLRDRAARDVLRGDGDLR